MPSYGLIFKTPDPGEPRHVPARRFMATLPPWLDISAARGPYLDQGALGSCGPNTAAECINFDQSAEGIPVFLVSRLFIYYQTRYLMGTVSQDSGVDNKTMLAAINQFGFPPEADDPYVIADFTKKPSDKAYSDALPNRITSYAVVPQDLAVMQGTLVGRRPWMFGFNVFRQIESAEAAKTGLIRDPAPGEAAVGGHDVTCFGYNLSGADLPGVKPGNVWPNGTLKVGNHWTNADGSRWGDDGYGYISTRYALDPSLAGDFWVINAVPSPGVVPPPPPPPPPPPVSPCRKVARAIFRGVQAANDEMLGGSCKGTVWDWLAHCGNIPQ